MVVLLVALLQVLPRVKAFLGVLVPIDEREGPDAVVGAFGPLGHSLGRPRALLPLVVVGRDEV
eukprot:1774886-Lingulodinium_polyedra.AAC.1